MLIITLGDPLSISVECLLRERGLWSTQVSEQVIIVGSRAQWDYQTQSLGLAAIPMQTIRSWQEIRGPGLYFLNIDASSSLTDPRELTPKIRGQLAVAALDQLKLLPPRTAPLAVLTAPIDKAVCAAAGFTFPGQTEYFEDLWAAPGIMILAGPRLRVALATNHVALARVPWLLTEDLLERKCRLLLNSLQQIFGIQHPKIAIAGLNPHCGDGGLFGREDQLLIAPVVKKLRAEGFDVEGPLPADTIFFRAYSGEFAAVLAMYHDQGLGPLKSLHFYDAVNVTGGLPHLRISPDHGPAADLYGRSMARSDSFRQALQRALTYLRH